MLGHRHMQLEMSQPLPTARRAVVAARFFFVRFRLWWAYFFDRFDVFDYFAHLERGVI